MPISAHGALLSYEQTAPNVFVTIAQLNSNIDNGLSHEEENITPHNNTIDFYVVSPVIMRDPWTFAVNFGYAEGTHVAPDGLLQKFLDNEEFGMRFTGIESTGAGTDEFICSGQITSFKQRNPVRNGARMADIVFRPSGLGKLNGVIIGT